MCIQKHIHTYVCIYTYMSFFHAASAWDPGICRRQLGLHIVRLSMLGAGRGPQLGCLDVCFIGFRV